ncbi:DUF429 domain-containing protein [Halorientalis brevis]|uniref:DUF429 domain-containing protein n=1 Tax=Halorientalis brevis TaxID=1126241 RepID=A0ABD6CC19_9EURY
MTATLHGIDFSGARQAGHGIWLAEATVDGDSLRVESCASAADRFGVAERAPCLGRLCAFLRDASVVGLDVSFGVPAPVHGRDTWEDSLEWVATAATDVDGFEEACVSRAEQTGSDRTYLLRETDGPVGAQSPYHWLVASQTFHGIRDVLAPLARTDDVCVRPMQSPADATPDATQLCEVYPAATLATCSLPAREYKDDDGPARERREEIVDGLEAATAIEFAADVRGQLIDDAGGDALDAVVAALATHRAREADFEPDRAYDPVEGHIYV